MAKRQAFSSMGRVTNQHRSYASNITASKQPAGELAAAAHSAVLPAPDLGLHMNPVKEYIAM